MGWKVNIKIPPECNDGVSNDTTPRGLGWYLDAYLSPRVCKYFRINALIA